MFSLQPRDELVFGAPPTNHIQQTGEILDDDLIADPAFIQSNSIINFTSGSCSTKLQQPLVGGETGPPQRETRKKDLYGQRSVLHRENERKRRQEMSNLHASLRAILPLDELVKGKRSMCDHMQEAVNYIKQLEKKIQELEIRRDKLKKFWDVSGNQAGSSNDENELPPNLVTVNLAGKGLEILISCSFRSTHFRLSKMFDELLKKEIFVVNCVSTKIKREVSPYNRGRGK